MGWKDVARMASQWVDAAVRATAEATPENVAARRAAEQEREAEERRDRLAQMVAGGETAELTLSISGAEHGATTVTLPCERCEDHPAPEVGETGPQLWIVDPHGNLVLRYDAKVNGKHVLDDLRHLLKLSNIG